MTIIWIIREKIIRLSVPYCVPLFIDFICYIYSNMVQHRTVHEQDYKAVINSTEAALFSCIPLYLKHTRIDGTDRPFKSWQASENNKLW